MSRETPHDNVYWIEIPPDYDDRDSSGGNDNYSGQVTPVDGESSGLHGNSRRHSQLSSQPRDEDVIATVSLAPVVHSSGDEVNITRRADGQEAALVEGDVQALGVSDNAREQVGTMTPQLVRL
ncbi:hypothetical protein LSAT2_000281 [Lamellibrachia satsuma]|nr:hypothetical protein LSAT2_000281 [Lamellibrachia satsuma]